MKKIIFLVLLVVIFSNALVANAAEISATSAKGTYGIESHFTISIKLISAKEPINAFEGYIDVPQGVIVEDIHESMSVPTTWIESPKLQGNRVVFAGIIPGGYEGVLSPLSSGLIKGTIFNIDLYVKKKGDLLLNPIITSAYANNASHDEVNVKSLPLSLSIDNSTSTSHTVVDNIPPDRFRIEIGNNRSVFNGKYFIVFNTFDGGSGVDYYVVKEGEHEPVISQNQYVLKDQRLNSDIFVTAYDREGNYVIEKLNASNTKKTYGINDIISVLIFFVIVLIIFTTWKKSKKL